MSYSSADQRCPNCQHLNPPDALTCANCGLTLAAATPLAHDHSRAPLFDFPPQLSASLPVLQPASLPAAAPTRARHRLRIGSRAGMLLLAALIVLALSGGVAAYLLLRPNPTITISSDYTMGSLPVGASSTALHIRGQRFSSNSAITLLLDGQPVSASQPVFSDGSGNFSVNLRVSDQWGLGQHLLTARDASHFLTQTGRQIDIVTPGEATTPGPNGAPTDSGDFNVIFTVTRQDAVTGKPLNSFKATITVHGLAPANQQVCRAQVDTGQTQLYVGSDSIGDYEELFAWTCSGSYKNGKLLYTETAIIDTVTYFNGMTCVANTPYTFIQLEGTFSAANAISGAYTADTVQYTCDRGGTLQTNPETGTWEGSTS